MFPQTLLYPLLPHGVDYAPYTFTHVLTQLQLLLFAGLAFVTLMKTGLYPPEIPSLNVDFDWFYRRLLPGVATRSWNFALHVWETINAEVARHVRTLIVALFRHHGPHGMLARTWPTASMVLWVAVLLASCLIFYYL
jgi:multicomponent Na+:H+ antiporter subunit D